MRVVKTQGRTVAFAPQHGLSESDICSSPLIPAMGRRRGGHGLPIRRRTPAEDASATELWFDTWFDIRPYEDLVTVEQGDGELFGIWPRLHMRAAPLVVIHLETLAYVAAERLWPPCAPRLQVRPGCVELVASMKEVVQLAVICADTYVPEPPYCTYGLRVAASCVLYVPKARGSLPRGRLLYQPRRAVGPTRILWHHRP